MNKAQKREAAEQMIKVIDHLNKEFEKLSQQIEDETSTQHDKIVDLREIDIEIDGMNKELLKLIRSTNELDIMIENRKLLRLIKENLEFFRKSYIGHIPK